MELSVAILVSSFILSFGGSIFVIIGLRHTANKTVLDTIDVQLKALEIALTECRSELARTKFVHSENELLRTENINLLRQLRRLQSNDIH